MSLTKTALPVTTDLMTDPILQEPVLVVGNSGSGKTYTGKGIVERLLRDKRRVCVIDPTDVWWGFRAKPNGAAGGFPVMIFGGSHGDVPINEHAGTALGRLVGEGSLQCVISLADMLIGPQRRFMSRFFEAVYQAQGVLKRPLHLVIDEADEFGPQISKSSKQDEEGGLSTLLGHYDRIARRGRTRGFRLLNITQRPALLNTAIRAQCQTLIAHQLTLPHDRKAIRDWVLGQTDEKSAKDMLDSMPRLQKGECWLAAFKWDILTRCRSAKISTFDSSATPGDDHAAAVTADLASIDVSEISKAMAEAIEETKANDPKLLKARIAELEEQLADQPTVTLEERESDVAVIDGIRYDRTIIELIQSERSTAQRERDQFQADAEAMNRRAELFSHANAKAIQILQAAHKEGDGLATERFIEASNNETHSAPIHIARTDWSLPAPKLSSANGATSAKTPAVLDSGGDGSGPQLHRPRAGQSGPVPGRQQAILDSLAWWHSAGIKTPTRRQVGWLCKKSSAGGTFRNDLGALRTIGLIDYPNDGTLALTEAGRASAKFPTTRLTLSEVRARARSTLAPRQQEILDAIFNGGMLQYSREQIGKAVGKSHEGGTFRNDLGAMRSAGLIEYPSEGRVMLSPLLTRLS